MRLPRSDRLQGMARLRLTDEQWKRVEPLLPTLRTPSAQGGRPPVDRRMVLDGILWVLRTGAAWRDMPQEFGAWQTAWRVFDEWNREGTLDRILEAMQIERLEQGKMDHHLWCIDSSIVRAARCAGGGGKRGIRRNRRIMR